MHQLHRKTQALQPPSALASAAPEYAPDVFLSWSYHEPTYRPGEKRSHQSIIFSLMSYPLVVLDACVQCFHIAPPLETILGDNILAEESSSAATLSRVKGIP